MDANTMQFAMEQMKKMNPEQLQAMMSSMPPDMMGQAMSQMKDMKPEDWERAKKEMSGMDADTMARQAAQAQAQMAGRTQYVLSASNQLKQEGNQLHGRGAYTEAVEKYERAKSNVESFTSKEAQDLARACTLNLSSCYLNLKQYGKCLEQCNQVLAGEANNLKALYRRGQAQMGCGEWLSAASDLERALRLAIDTDPAQAQPIRDKLQETKDQIGALRAAGKLPPAGAAPSGAAAAIAAPSSPSTTGASAAPGSPSSSSSQAVGGSGASGGSSGGPVMPDPAMMARASEMMRANPEMLKQAQDMMRGMSDNDLRGMARQMGMEVPPEVLRGGLGNMDPETIAKMAQIQAELPPELRGPDAARNPESMQRLADLMAQKPEMAATMGQMLTSLEPEKLQEMSRAAGLPAGVTITPELAKLAAESFQRMSPAEVQAAMKAAASMAPGASGAAAAGSREGSAAAASTSGRDGAAALAPAVAGMPPVDPRVAADMLAAMTPEQLSSISKMMPGGEKMNLTPEMAKMAAEMMKGMTAEDMQRMQGMATAMGRGGGGAGGSGAAPAMAMPGLGAGGGGFSPEMAKMASEMMQGMKPEDMQQMQEMASKLGMGGAAGPAGGMPGLGGMGTSPDAMASMMGNPQMMESAIRMMKGMDPEALASMMMSSGMCKDRTQAAAMASQMNSLSDTQLRMMMKTAGAVASARAGGERALAWARRNMLLVGALVILLLALLLRWLGFM